ncbi:MAG: NAD-dependent epimerase, partial [Nitrospinota bacterium]
FVAGRPALVIPAGFNVVDARDVARGHLLAEERGRPGERYLLGGANLTLAEFYRRLAALLGRWRLRLYLPRALAWTVGAAAELLCRPLGKSPPVSRSLVAEYFGRYAYCDTTKAERELGYRARPLEETLRASVRWFVEEFSANPPRPGGSLRG